MNVGLLSEGKMHSKVRTVISAIAMTAALSTAAQAYCPSPSVFGDFNRQVNNNLDYLLCLHNEQVTSLNNHARMLNSLADDMDRISSAQSRLGQALTADTASSTLVREVIANYTAIAAENLYLGEKVVELERRIEVLEGR